MTIEEILMRGGVVVWILGGYTLVALTIIIERLIFFSLQGKPSSKLEQDLSLFFTKQEASPQSQAQLLDQHKACEETRLIRAMLQTGSTKFNSLAQTATRMGNKARQRLERGFRTLHILGNTAPLLGLFGTVLGMIKAFIVIEESGGRVDAQALAGGIWEAMITTGVGLAVSLAILLLLHLLESLADRRIQRLQYYANVALEQICKDTETSQQKHEALHAV